MISSEGEQWGRYNLPRIILQELPQFTNQKAETSGPVAPPIQFQECNMVTSVNEITILHPEMPNIFSWIYHDTPTMLLLDKNTLPV